MSMTNMVVQQCFHQISSDLCFCWQFGSDREREDKVREVVGGNDKMSPTVVAIVDNLALDNG